MNNITLEMVMPVLELEPKQIIDIFAMLGATSASGTLELVMPVAQLKPEQIIGVFNILGATSAGGCALLDSQYGAGGRYAALIQMKGEKYFWSWCESQNRFSIKPVTNKETCVELSEIQVTVRGFRTGDTVMFKTEQDAKEWLLRLSSPDQLQLDVQAPNFKGPAVMYLTEEFAKKADETKK